MSLYDVLRAAQQMRLDYSLVCHLNFLLCIPFYLEGNYTVHFRDNFIYRIVGEERVEDDKKLENIKLRNRKNLNIFIYRREFGS